MNHREQGPQTGSTKAMSHDEALDIINGAARLAHMAQQVDRLRERSCQFMCAMVREVELELGRCEFKAPAVLRAQPDSAGALRDASRRRQRLARDRRELAEAMVLGTLFNLDNPDWNPVHDRIRGNGSAGVLMALLTPATS